MPPLVLSSVAQFGNVTLPQSLAWLDSPLALVLLGVATLIEIGAYYLPFVDNLLDAVAAPLAVAAGVATTFAFGAELDPALRWGLALIAGGGAAGGIQTLTSLTRLGSSATTGGLGNPVVATFENVASAVLSVLAIFFPVIAFALVVALLVVAVRRLNSWRSKRRATT